MMRRREPRIAAATGPVASPEIGLAAGRAASPKIGLALAGGGPLGAIHEIGALCALQEALPALDFTALDGYVGVSAGSFIAAGLANGMTPRQLCRAFIENDGPRADRIAPGLFFRPAWREYARRAAMLPGLAVEAGVKLASRRKGLLAAAETLGRALPTGLFSHTALQAQLARVFSAPGRSNDFRRLKQRLVLVATDLDSGEAAPFGAPGWDEVPISQAVAASASLPGLFPPLAVNGRWYVDGALKKTLHASMLLDDGLDLLLCLNPLVPFGAGTPTTIPRLVDGGLPLLLSQTFRSLIHSRLEIGLKGYRHSHPDTDIVLFEPDHHDAALFSANTFGVAGRRALAEHAYQRTRAELRSRRATLSPMLARHGLALDDAVLGDHTRRLLGPRAPGGQRMAQTLARLDEVLVELHGRLPAGG